jgi:hypothetical protein
MLTGLDGSACGRQGGPTLIATTRTPNARPSPRARRLRAKVRAHLISRGRTGAGWRDARAAAVNIGLVVLVGFTARVVATVSVWWVPPYLAFMALIFVTPGGWRRRVRALQLSSHSIAADRTELARGKRVDRAEGADQLSPVAAQVSGVTFAESTEISVSNSDSAGPATAQPRRGRARARKVAKTAAEVMPAPPPVAWKQVGPGKFVRVEGGVPPIPQSQTEDAPAAASPAPDTPVDVLVSPPVRGPSAEESSTEPDTCAGDKEIAAESDVGVSVSVPEEYGIAPSAFSPALSVTPFGEGLAEHLSGALAVPGVHHGLTAIRGHKMPQRYRDTKQLSAHRQVSRVRRRLASGWLPSIARQRQAAHRAFGRITHVERALRPRSPPYGHTLRWLRRPGSPRLTRGDLRPAESAHRINIASP